VPDPSGPFDDIVTSPGPGGGAGGRGADGPAVVNDTLNRHRLCDGCAVGARGLDLKLRCVRNRGSQKFSGPRCQRREADLPVGSA
jgi:hypothetical protein